MLFSFTAPCIFYCSGKVGYDRAAFGDNLFYVSGRRRFRRDEFPGIFRNLSEDGGFIYERRLIWYIRLFKSPFIQKDIITMRTESGGILLMYRKILMVIFQIILQITEILSEDE